jgi:hypothetical protein
MFSSKPMKIPNFGDVIKDGLEISGLVTTTQATAFPITNTTFIKAERILMIRKCL